MKAGGALSAAFLTKYPTSHHRRLSNDRLLINLTTRAEPKG